MKTEFYRIAAFVILFSLFGSVTLAQEPGTNDPDDDNEASSRVYLPLLSSSTQSSDVLPEASAENVEAADQLEIVYQDEATALAADTALLAEQSGNPFDSVDKSVRSKRAFADYAEELSLRYPDQISSIYTNPVPQKGGYIQFVGIVPEEVIREIEERELGDLDFSDVVIAGGGMVPLAQHYHHAELTAEAMADVGYRNLVAFYDPIEQVVRVEIKLPEDVDAPSSTQILDLVQNRAATEQALGDDGTVTAVTVQDFALEIVVIRGTGPMVVPESGRGGNWLQDEGVNRCTSGWAVNGNLGGGIVTAGHCSGLDDLVVPGNGLLSTQWRRQIYGSGGDVEYHTVSGQVSAEFYANATSVRDVTGIAFTGAMPNGDVCIYGRQTNRRQCVSVEAVNIIAIDDRNTRVTNLARTTPISSTDGDSGGGWSYGSTAWGVHHGSGRGDNLNKGYFTPIDQTVAVLNVSILTKN